jgi:hypothetical protein
MIHQDQAGLILADFFKAFRFIFESGSHHHKDGEKTDQQSPEDMDLPGIFMLRTGLGHYLVKRHFYDGCFHMALPFCYLFFIIQEQPTFVKIS